MLSTSDNAHAFRYAEPYHAENVLGMHVPGPFADPPTAEVLVINHYLTKSKEDFLEKIKRGAVTGGRGKVQY